PLNRPPDPHHLLMDQAEIVFDKGSGVVGPQRAFDEELDPRERIANLVGDAGREMTDRAELLRAKQVPLLLLQPLADFLDAADYPVELFVEIVGRMRTLDG